MAISSGDLRHAQKLNPCGRRPGHRTRRLLRQTHFLKNDETAFRLQAAASKVTGLQACGSNSTPAVRLSGFPRPITADQVRPRPIDCFPDNSAGIEAAGASNLDARIRQARKNLRYERGPGRAGRRSEFRFCRAPALRFRSLGVVLLMYSRVLRQRIEDR